MRKRWKVGDIVKIDLENGYLSFGRVLESPLIAFYDIRTKETPPIEEIISSTVLFKVFVMHYAVKSGHWPILENRPLDNSLKELVRFFRQDVLSGELFIHYPDGTEIPATREDCEGLECAAVWDPEHVEDRLRDHFAGVPNVSVELMKIKPRGETGKTTD